MGNEDLRVFSSIKTNQSTLARLQEVNRVPNAFLLAYRGIKRRRRLKTAKAASVRGSKEVSSDVRSEVQPPSTCGSAMSEQLADILFFSCFQSFILAVHERFSRPRRVLLSSNRLLACFKLSFCANFELNELGMHLKLSSAPFELVCHIFRNSPIRRRCQQSESLRCGDERKNDRNTRKIRSRGDSTKSLTGDWAETILTSHTRKSRHLIFSTSRT